MLKVIPGGKFTDQRGSIQYFNDFDMSAVKRFFVLQHEDTTMIRGWRGHKIEQRWFLVLSGTFSVHVVKIDNWIKPSPDLPTKKYILKEGDSQILHVPAGHAVAFRAIHPGSRLLVYADHMLAHAKKDDYTWSSDYFLDSNGHFTNRVENKALISHYDQVQSK